MKRLKTLAVVRIGWIEYGFESEKDAISFLSMAKKIADDRHIRERRICNYFNITGEPIFQKRRDQVNQQ